MGRVLVDPQRTAHLHTVSDHPCQCRTLTSCGSSGEFHTFRLPVPDLWPDILQKMKAAGLNAVSL
jgi:hypothetical protein